MALQGLTVPSPAQGTDWSYTVPGQYVLDVRAVTAQLAATADPGTAVDAGPNGYNGVYSGAPNITWGVTGPFGGGGGLAIQQTAHSADQYIFEYVNSGGQFDVSTFSVDAIVAFSGVGINAMNDLVAIRSASASPPGKWRWIFGLGTSPNSLQMDPSLGVGITLGTGITSNVYTHVGFSWDGTQWIGYINGTAAVTHVGDPPGLTFTDLPLTVGGDLISPQCFDGKIAAVAVYSGALSAARFAAHQAAIATSAAAYKSAVLADTPLALWMLDETVQHFQRSVTLQVTDGTNLLGQFPGFEPAQQSPLFHFTWATDASSASQSGDQSVTFLPIPPLKLYPGMVLRSETLDLTALDQWSDIVVWADTSDSSIPPDGGGPGTVGYLDATLYPDVPTG